MLRKLMVIGESLKAGKKTYPPEPQPALRLRQACWAGGSTTAFLPETPFFVLPSATDMTKMPV